MKIIKNKVKDIGFLLVVTVLTISFLAIVPTVHADYITVDFEGIDASGGLVGGTILDNYLAGYGISISDVTPDTHPKVWDLDASTWKPVIPSSGKNVLHHVYDYGIYPMEFTLDFSTSLLSFGFTRPTIVDPSGIIIPEWHAYALDAQGVVIASAGQNIHSIWGTESALNYMFDIPGIASVRFVSSTHGYAGLSGVVLDDFTFESTPIPEPTTMLLLGSGLIGLAGLRRKMKNRRQ